jgi:hypothetical protein
MSSSEPITLEHRSRRHLLKFLLSSPLIAPFIDLAAALDTRSGIITDPDMALYVFNFEAVARAARTRNHLMILSTVSSTSVEEVIAARGGPWRPGLVPALPADQPPIARALVKRAEAAGCPVLVLTVDIQGGSNRETLERAVRLDKRDCSACHEGRVFTNPAAFVARKPMFEGLDVSGVTSIAPMA